MLKSTLQKRVSAGFRLNITPTANLVPTFEIGDRIPKIIHQTYHSRPWPDAFETNAEHLKTVNPLWEYCFYDYEQRRVFIKDTYGASVLEIYDSIDERYGAARADLFRYLLLYKRGGLYLDMKSTTSRSLDEVLRPGDVYLLSTWRNEKHDDYPSWGRHPEVSHRPFGEFQQWHIAAAPGHPFLKAIIENVLRNVQVYLSGLHGTGAYAVLRVTGPVAYTLAIEPLLNRCQFRIVDSKYDLGLVYSVFDRGDARRHEKMFPHYSSVQAPLVRQNSLRRILNLPLLAGRKLTRLKKMPAGI